MGDDFETGLYKFSPPTRFGKKYREQLRSARNLKCLLNATVTEVQVSANGSHVTALKIQDTLGARPPLQVSGRRYVMAAGGIENARLLLISNQTQSSGVGSGQEHVGKYFMEHPHLHSEGRFYRTKNMPPLKLYTCLLYTSPSPRD